MGWMQKLYETYENCSQLVGVREAGGKPPLMPIYHTTQQAQIEAAIDTNGGWRSAEVLEEKNRRTTLIPCTEKSASRTSDPVSPHPLFDTLSYLAGDYADYRTVKPDRKGRYAEYIARLSEWCSSPFAHPSVCAVLAYLKKGCLMADLIRAGVLYADANGRLPEKWEGPKEAEPKIFKAATGDPANAFLRFQVVSACGEVMDHSRIWEDPSVWKSFIDYQNSLPAQRDFCYVLGKKMPPSQVSPRYIRRPGDGAKLISANDKDGFTFRGRFETAEQAFRIGRETSEKAHHALKWLIPRQAYVNGDQVILTWRTDGGKVPDPCKNALDLLYEMEPEKPQAETGENFAYRLRNALRGYGRRLKGGEEACILGLDSATPGRLSIFYYREMREKDLLNRVALWNKSCGWRFQGYPKGYYEKGAKPVPFIGAPAPDVIVEAAYGRQMNDKLKKSAVQRLLPCIADGAALPRDMMQRAVRRASNPIALEDSERTVVPAVACALVHKYWNDDYNFNPNRQNKPRNISETEYEERWKMLLDTEETDRSYLFGRALAYAQNLESSALRKIQADRNTNAERMQVAFSQHPAKTWETLYHVLLPYLQKMGSVVSRQREELNHVIAQIPKEEFNNDPLDEIYLLGYACQMDQFQKEMREAVRKKQDTNEKEQKEEEVQ